jgi:hypothetical protein
MQGATAIHRYRLAARVPRSKAKLACENEHFPGDSHAWHRRIEKGPVVQDLPDQLVFELLSGGTAILVVGDFGVK